MILNKIILYYVILYYMHVHKRPRRGGAWDHRRYATLGVAPCAGFGCQGLRKCCSCSFSSSGQVPNCAKFTKLAAASAPAPGGHGPNLARFTNLVSIGSPKCWFYRVSKVLQLQLQNLLLSGFETAGLHVSPSLERLPQASRNSSHQLAQGSKIAKSIPL